MSITNLKDMVARLRELLAYNRSLMSGCPNLCSPGKPMETGFGPIEPLSGVDLDLIVEAINALPTIFDQNDRMANALREIDTYRDSGDLGMEIAGIAHNALEGRTDDA